MESTLNVSIKIAGALSTTASANDRIDKALRDVLSSLTNTVVQDISLTPSETDHTVDFGELASASIMIFFSDQPLSVKLNGAAAAVTVGKTFVAYNSASLTSASLTNTVASAASVTVVLAV
jgi:hypothetical protein